MLLVNPSLIVCVMCKFEREKTETCLFTTDVYWMKIKSLEIYNITAEETFHFFTSKTSKLYWCVSVNVSLVSYDNKSKFKCIFLYR